jgi:CDP-glycerol glycerophosphotransferase (TagB/SpsB family)
MLILLDVSNIYYLPQFLPVIRELSASEHDVKLVCHRNNIKSQFESVLADTGVDYLWVNDCSEALKVFIELSPDWIFFANGFKHINQLPSETKTVQLGHGVGPKPSYYHKSSTPMTVRFMEGAERLKQIKTLYPDDEFIQVGYSKLDPIVNGEEPGLDLEHIGLDSNKQTILYAPTFNPSSLECFPDDWPKHFTGYNILIKPHTFTFTIEQYKKQRAKLVKWAKYENVFVASEDDLSIIPFMKSADILLSEASSTLFEFAALDKPVIVCDFFKLKWTYRGPFYYRFVKRFGKDNVLYRGIGLHVKSFKELLTAIPQQLANPQEYAVNRSQFTHDHVGPMDGKASKRIVEYISSH